MPVPAKRITDWRQPHRFKRSVVPGAGKNAVGRDTEKPERAFRKVSKIRRKNILGEEEKTISTESSPPAGIGTIYTPMPPAPATSAHHDGRDGTDKLHLVHCGRSHGGRSDRGRIDVRASCLLLHPSREQERAGDVPGRVSETARRWKVMSNHLAVATSRKSSNRGCMRWSSRTCPVRLRRLFGQTPTVELRMPAQPGSVLLSYQSTPNAALRNSDLPTAGKTGP